MDSASVARARSGAFRVVLIVGLILLPGVACAGPGSVAAPPDDEACRFALKMTDVCYANSLRLAGSCDELRGALAAEMSRRRVDQPGFPEFCASVCQAARKGIPRENVRVTIARETRCE